MIGKTLLGVQRTLEELRHLKRNIGGDSWGKGKRREQAGSDFDQVGKKGK